MKTQQTIWITGATGSIGGALAKAYAAPGVRLILQGRKAQLAELADICRTLGAQVEEFFLDLSDINGLRAWAQKLVKVAPPDIFISNAGVNINISEDAQGERWEDICNLLNVNVFASMALVNVIIPVMRKRGHGQIALVSSLAAYYGLPMTPSYSASKAAIKAYGEGLRGWLANESIQVNVIMPGYVSSPMCDAMPGPKLFMWQPDKAAHYIRKKLAVNQARISFPFPLNYGTWWLAVLPASISQRILHWIGYRA